MLFLSHSHVMWSREDNVFLFCRFIDVQRTLLLFFLFFFFNNYLCFILHFGFRFKNLKHNCLKATDGVIQDILIVLVFFFVTKLSLIELDLTAFISLFFSIIDVTLKFNMRYLTYRFIE